MKFHKKGKIKFKDWFTIYFKPAVYENSSFWIFLTVFFIISIVIFNLKDYISDEFWSGVLVEATGFLFDIFLFGIIFTIYDSISNKKKLIQSYRDEIAFFEGLDFDESTLRIIGNIRLLNRYKATEITLDDTTFENAYLDSLNLTNSILQDNYFKKCTVSNLIFKSVFNRINNYEECKISGTNFNNCHYEYSDFESCIIFNTTFENSNLKDIKFRKCILNEISFKNAKFEKVSFDFCIVDDENWIDYLQIDSSYKNDLSEKYIAINKNSFDKNLNNIQKKFEINVENWDEEFSKPHIIIERNLLIDNKN